MSCGSASWTVRGLRRVLAIPDADLFTPVLSKDGRTVFFGRRGHNADDGIYMKALDDGSAPRRIVSVPTDDIQSSALERRSRRIGTHRGPRRSRSEERHLLRGDSGVGGRRVGVQADRRRPGRRVRRAALPDGRFIAYSSDESGGPRSTSQRSAATAPVGETLRVTRSSGANPTWSADGRTLRYVEPERSGHVAPCGDDVRRYRSAPPPWCSTGRN